MLNLNFKSQIIWNCPLMALEFRNDLLAEEVRGATEPECEATEDIGTGDSDRLLYEFFPYRRTPVSQGVRKGGSFRIAVG
jgi:hypothetical protein